jgi:phage baseplate assembly protein W
MGLVSGRTALAQAIIRRLTTQTGSLPDFQNYGFDLSQLIGTTYSKSQIRHAVASQVLLEEEVDDCTVDAEVTDTTVKLSIAILDGEGPFDLTISVDDLTVEYIIGG